ncbi:MULTISPECIES: hypothetical protein [Kitasatospora]|uniref:Uncharacterized protein n=1 Tax=Kitasatospora setae (strain ATCC 33774 / DSM 43861 / JCM 3304 / KCC A-0304 / NBRC 14216 / KM-6054) TaxID=452652 RepID=E4N6Y4_KITSK|nr:MULTISPECIES: hypothetical protein [Kitasatospora]BAJ26965.1 hypothetical protein KSE_11310 [Kitasatospora setae KM-6054]
MDGNGRATGEPTSEDSTTRKTAGPPPPPTHLAPPHPAPPARAHVPPEQPDQPGRPGRWQRGRRAIAGGLLALALLLIALVYAAARAARNGGLVVLIEVFHHPLPYGAAVLALIVLAVLVGFRSRGTRALLLVPILGGALLVSPLALFGFGSAPHRTADRPAPGRSDRSLVIHEGTAVIDPLWWVSVDVGSGLTAHRWRVGYFNGDAPDNALASAQWDGPDRIRLATEGGEVFVVALDPATGRPDHQVRAG